jgi:hypothetical protein
MSGIDSVHTGSWTDYSQGRDRLITLTNRDAHFLIAFLAVFVSLTGGRLWSEWPWRTVLATYADDHSNNIFRRSPVTIRW